MSDVASAAFIIVTALCSFYFVFSRRRFDFLAIAWLGALYYFSPLLSGRVIRLGANLDTSIPSQVYLIASVYMLGLIVGGAISERVSSTSRNEIQTPSTLSGWFLFLGLIGLAGALLASNGAIIDHDKVQALKQVGYWYALFEIAACLTCIASVQERCWTRLAGGILLLAVDLLIGFRVFVVLTALSISLVMLVRDRGIRLFTKAPSYGVAALLLVVSMLLVHSARFAIFEQIAILRDGSDRVISPQKPARGDTLQYIEAFDEPANTADATALSRVLHWPNRLLHLFQRTEPYVIQAILVETVHSDFSCEPFNALKSLYLLAPPGITRILPNPFPPTFYDEYQPTLFPAVNYGLGGNIWSEMLCRFGYIGDFALGVFLIAALIGAQRLLLTAPAPLVAPLAFGGVILAFYIHRNDVHYTLVLLRQTAMVFVAAYALSYIYKAISADRTQKPNIPGSTTNNIGPLAKKQQT